MKIRSCLLAAALAAQFSPAFAADYDPPIVVDDAPEYQPVEVGSGWYLRGDIGYAFSKSYKDIDYDANNSFSELAPFAPTDAFSFSDDQTTVTGNVGVGYHFNDYLRADIDFGIMQPDKYEIRGIRPDNCGGTQRVTVQALDAGGAANGPPTVTDTAATRDCDSTAGAKTTSWTGTANAYVDLGTYVGLTPYVGAGVGVIRTKTRASAGKTCIGTNSGAVPDADPATENTTTEFICEGQTESDVDDVTRASYEKTNYDLLYSLSAGLSYRMGANTSLDVGYQYTMAPSVEYLTADPDGVHQRKGIDYHQIRVGLRYDLW